MPGETTVTDAIERVRERLRYKRCPDCGETASIRGFGGEYRWECLDCDAIGLGYSSRGDAFADLKRRWRRGRV